jgi:hypothetical protein
MNKRRPQRSMLPFSASHSLEDILEGALTRIADLEYRLDDEVYLYVTPEKPLDIFVAEARDWNRILERNKGRPTVYREEMDGEALAYYFLSDEDKIRLTN